MNCETSDVAPQREQLWACTQSHPGMTVVSVELSLTISLTLLLEGITPLVSHQVLRLH